MFLGSRPWANQHSRPVCESVCLASVPNASASVPQLVSKAKFWQSQPDSTAGSGSDARRDEGIGGVSRKKGREQILLGVDTGGKTGLQVRSVVPLW